MLRELPGGIAVASKNRGSVSIFVVVNHFNGGIEIGNPYHAKHGPENFFFVDGHFRGHVVKKTTSYIISIFMPFHLKIAAVHDKHAQIYDASVNGSGGEVFRNYWWDRSTVSRPDAPPAAAHRFAGTAQRPGFLAAEHIRDASTHFEEVVTRSLAGLDLPAHAKLDHVYLMLRMQCWQGSIGSATNQIWPNISPLMWEAPMRVLFGADPLVRMDGHLIFELMSRFSSPFRNRLLATGFPPRRFSLPAFWRFLPGLAVAPFRLWPRVKGRLVPARPTIADREVVRSVLATGGGDVLDPRGLHLLPLLDRARYETFLARARKEGDVSRALLGRLLTLELAYRNANQARVRA